MRIFTRYMEYNRTYGNARASRKPRLPALARRIIRDLRTVALQLLSNRGSDNVRSRGTLAGCCLLFPLLAGAQPFVPELENALKSRLDSIQQTYGVPGILFSLRLNDDLQFHLASGFEDPELGNPLPADGKMLSGSVGKIFFSTLILRLIQERKLALEDPVSDYLGDRPWYASFPNHEALKIHHLLNHTSGLPRHLFQPEFLEAFTADPLLARNPESCIQSISGKPALHPSGEGWAYSDTNYILLGLILEKITGMDAYALVDQEFLTPLGLSKTVPSDRREIPGLVQGHVGDQNPFQLPKKILLENGELAVHPAFEWTGGGFATNPADLTRMVQFIHQGEYLTADTRRLLTSAVSMTTGKPYDHGYGLGSFIWSRKEDRRYGHSGFFPGYVSHVEYSERRQYALAIQVNDDGAYPYLQQFIYEMEKVVEAYLDRLDDYAIRENFRKQEACWNRADIACYMEAYARSAPIQTVSRAGVTHGYDQIIADYRTYFPQDRMGRLHFDNLETRRLEDDRYFVTGRFNLELPGREEPVSGWFSTNMKKINGQWLMITDHSS